MSHIDYNEDNPGPGTYWINYKHVLPRSPQHAIAHHIPIRLDYGYPGPGTYNLREEVPAVGDRGYTVGRRFTTKGSPTPGSGANIQHTMEGKLNKGASRPGSPGVGANNIRSQEFSGPRYSMGRRFYRLRDMKRERRYSRALKHRPKLAREKSPAAVVEPHEPDDFHRRHSHRVHRKPEIPRRASSRFVSPPPPARTVSVETQVELIPAPGLAAPAAPAPMAKTNAWMDIGKRLQRTRDAISAAAAIPAPELVADVEPEPPPPPPK